MGIEQVFDNLTFKHMHALRKQIQYLSIMFGTYLEPLFSGDMQ